MAVPANKDNSPRITGKKSLSMITGISTYKVKRKKELEKKQSLENQSE